MKRLLVFLVLVLHINTSMFMPVMDEVDMYDAYGNQVGDINSLVQLVDEFFLGNSNHSYPDYDDDHAHFFNVFHHIHPYILQKEAAPAIAAHLPALWQLKQQYALHGGDKLLFVAYDIAVPPPKC